MHPRSAYLVSSDPVTSHRQDGCHGFEEDSAIRVPRDRVLGDHQRIVSRRVVAPLRGQLPPRFLEGYLQVAPIFTLLSLFGFLLAGLFHGLWRYASTVTLFQVFKGVTLSADRARADHASSPRCRCSRAASS
mgnify:CR=1 FL=1